MKTIFVFLSVFVVCISLLADTSASIKSLPTPVQKAIETSGSQHVRVNYKEISVTKKTPCMPLGKSYDVYIQVKRAIGINKKGSVLIYEWDTVKTVNVGLDGKITEVCLE